jgi:hypothetical protein
VAFVERPEPGQWQFRVRAGKTNRPGTHTYTWGVQAETPLGLRLTPPRKPIGKKTHTFGAMFVDPSKLAASIKFAGSGAVSNVSIADLLTKHAKALKAIKLDLKPDTPKISKDLVKLPVLDAQMVASGKPSIFTSTPQKLAISGSGVNRKVSLATTVSGISSVSISVAGTTKKGLRFTRVARFDVRT